MWVVLARVQASFSCVFKVNLWPLRRASAYSFVSVFTAFPAVSRHNLHTVSIGLRLYQKSKAVVLHCKTCRFAFPNGLFRTLKRAVSEAKTARLVIPLIISELRRRCEWRIIYQKTKFLLLHHVIVICFHDISIGGQVSSVYGNFWLRLSLRQ